MGADETPVPGLYAAGECACVSVHGANRLGTNSLLDIVVFGRRGGAHMAEHAKEVDLAPLPDNPTTQTLDLLDAILTKGRGENAADIRKELQDHMFDLAFVVRSDEGLGEMQRILEELRERYDRVGITDKGAIYNTDLMETVEVGFLLDCAEAWSTPRAPAPRAAGALPRGSPPARRRQLAQALTRDTRAGGSIALDFKPVKMGPYIPMERKY